MATINSLNLGVPTSGASTLTPGLFATMQANINTWGMQFLPIAGGALSGPVQFAPSQQFLAQQVFLPNNPSYSHNGIWRTLWDHVNDPSVHRVAGPPQVHKTTHQIGGTDPITADTIGISTAQPTTSVKSYVDTSIASAVGAISFNWAPASAYEIGGTLPLYGNLVAISSSNATTDIKTYIDGSIAALSNSIPANPSFTTATVSTNLIFPGNANILAGSGGKAVFKAYGNLTSIIVPVSTGAIQFGINTNLTAFGSIGSAGLTMGSTVIGPASGTINGSLTTNGDIAVSRAALSAPTVGQISWASTAQAAYLSFNLDVSKQFFVSQPLTVSGNLTIAAGNTFSVGSSLSVSPTVLTTTGLQGLMTNGTGLLVLGADPNGSLDLRTSQSSGRPFINFTQGSTASTTPLYTQRIQLSADGTTLATTGAWSAVTLAANGGYTGSNGDLGIARSAAAGALYFGTTNHNSLDFGVTAAGSFTFTAGTTAVSHVAADGTYQTGSSTYGPLGASVNGILSATKTVEAATGITFGGISGYTFTNSGSNNDTGLFSNAAGDLRLITAGTSALSLLNGAAIFAGTVSAAGAINAATLASSGTMTVGSDLTITGRLYAGGATITKFRTKNQLELGWNTGTTSTSFTYPTRVVPAYVGATIDAIRLCALTADTTGAQTTIQISKNGVVIGTVQLPNGQKTAKNLPIQSNTPITEGDVLQATCTQAGTSTGVTVTLEISQFLT